MALQSLNKECSKEMGRFVAHWFSLLSVGSIPKINTTLSRRRSSWSHLMLFVSHCHANEPVDELTSVI